MAPQDTGISFQRWGYVFWVQGKFLFIAPYPTLINARPDVGRSIPSFTQPGSATPPRI